MAKTTLSFKTSVPKLKYLKPELTTMLFTFEVDKADVNPLFLQELSEKVRVDYLVPLNSTWGDLWKKWDDDLEKVLPDLATKTEGARKKLIDAYVGPLETEYNKQTANIQKMAQSIGERYWAEIARQRSELRDFRLLTAAKVIWKGLSVATSVVTIVSSGGTAVLSYVSALRSCYQIFGEFKKYNASADDYQIEVMKSIEALKIPMWKAEGSLKGFDKKQIDAKQHLKDMEKYVPDAIKELGALKDNLKILDVKIGKFHLAAGDLSKELDKALDKVEEALAVDPKLAEAQRSKIMSLILDVQRMSVEAKSLTKFFSQAQSFVKGAEKTLKEEETYVKTLKNVVKKGLTMAGTQIVETLVTVSGDIAAQKLLTKEVLDVGGLIDGWSKKIDTGLKILDTVIKVF